MAQHDTKVDAYIEKSADFAKPILTYLRELAHEASPLLTETIKWGCPFFDYKGPVCQIAAFKQHCAFGFWKAKLLNDPQGLINQGEPSAGSFGRITTIAELPPKEVLIDFIRQSIALNESEVKVPAKKTPAEKGELVIPDDLSSRLADNAEAQAVFAKFSYSQKKEYTDWLIDAKTEATRQKRLDTAIEWIGEGKTRMWKYK